MFVQVLNIVFNLVKFYSHIINCSGLRGQDSLCDKISSSIRIFFKHASRDSKLNKHESTKCYSDISLNL